ncbi:acyl-CoA carboxylase epsilon subunit [Streptomyces sp. ST2-7A]|uniref:acyl-CoA carboxylase epsilon subunit n=1 Tax=Streptomyces sp. ST2-7A TaxID=2907214 RepID=UPI001F18229E|nr:acyl-CoA carboxylase epsilon subunit [Streptomyces sp. ST2-7A]MCE7079898.1 acyl-CoA carboxylase subunit epsilon [Streptomyces sp. ST2-7A]
MSIASTDRIVPAHPAEPVRVERGRANDEELAAVTALLLARAGAARNTAPAAAPRRSVAGWRRLERTPGFRAPHSWQG